MGINIIVAFSTTFGIGLKGGIPWKIKDDLEHFRRLTMGNIVVMGKKTWESLGCRSLVGRTNIILTNIGQSERDDVAYNNDFKMMDEIELKQYIINENNKGKNIFIIGGESVFRMYMGVAEKIYSTHVYGNWESDVLFPIENFNMYEITYVGDEKVSDDFTKYRHITYSLSEKPHDEYAYLNSLQNILTYGKSRPDRTGVGTISVFVPEVLRFDISSTLPLFTTKQVSFKSILKELLWMLRGETDSKILEGQGVNIWKDNTTRGFLDKRGLHDYKEGWLGPLYGYNWRHFGFKYMGGDIDYTGKGYDQLEELISGLKNDPFSRRHMLTTYDPSVIDKCVLAPCHGIVIQFYVEEFGGNLHLSCSVYIRSNDMFLGNPYNTTSYSLLTCLIALKCDMLPKTLHLCIGDSHIYSNHVVQALQQIKRNPLPFPLLSINKDVKEKDWKDIKVEDFEVLGYLHHTKIVGKMAI